MGYTAARFVFEEMRIDPAHTVGPLRINAWVCIAVFLSTLAWFLWLRTHGTPVVRPDRDAPDATDIASESAADSA